MAFIIERIPENAEENFKYINRMLSSKWVIDKQQDIIFCLSEREGGPYEGTPEELFFALYWDKEIYFVRAVSGPLGSKNNKFYIAWTILDVRKDGQSLKILSNSLKQIIKDLFSAVGHCFNGDSFDSVDVNFNINDLE